MAKGKFRPNFQNLIFQNCEKQIASCEAQVESFYLNGHSIGFCPQTQKLESPYKTPSNTQAVKGLNTTRGNQIVRKGH